MGDTINLTALAETRAKMTPDWAADVWQNTNEGGWAAVGPHHKHDGACDEPGDPAHVKAVADATGIVAEHDAIGMLIEVARTLLVYSAAKREAARCRELWSSDWNNPVLQAAHQVADRALLLARKDHHVTLAKVSL